MKNMPRKEIEEIATNLLSSADIVAKHGTTVENALNIINTGFDYHRTSYVVQTSKSIEALCGYGWKDNKPDDATNVVIAVPREFFMDLLSLDNEGYQKWIQNVIDGNMQEAVLNSVTTFEMRSASRERTTANFSITTPAIFDAHIPLEFIAGTFIWCNGKTYLRLNEGESALDNLTFVENENYYLNMQAEAKEEFLRKMRLKMGIGEDGKKLK